MDGVKFRKARCLLKPDSGRLIYTLIILFQRKAGTEAEQGQDAKSHDRKRF